MIIKPHPTDAVFSLEPTFENNILDEDASYAKIKETLFACATDSQPKRTAIFPQRKMGASYDFIGKRIEKNIGTDIIIEPYDPKRINPNSYNLTLHNELLVYECESVGHEKAQSDALDPHPRRGVGIDAADVLSRADVEYTKTEKYVPMLEGRSSTGRLGLFIHVTAGFGTSASRVIGRWKCFAWQPIIIYPYTEICQIYYHDIHGEYDLYRSGKYQNNTGIQPSLMYRDFEK